MLQVTEKIIYFAALNYADRQTDSSVYGKEGKGMRRFLSA